MSTHGTARFAGALLLTGGIAFLGGCTKLSDVFTEVYANSPTNQADIAAMVRDRAGLAITYALGDTADSVTRDVVLPTSLANGTAVSWNSDQAAISTDSGTLGKVVRPLEQDKDVNLTATLTKGEVVASVAFPVKVTFSHGALTVTIALSDPSAAAVTFSVPDGQEVLKTSSLALSAAFTGATSIQWYVDNAGSAAGTGTPWTLDPTALGLDMGFHSLRLDVEKDGIWYAGRLAFTVTN